MVYIPPWSIFQSVVSQNELLYTLTITVYFPSATLQQGHLLAIEVQDLTLPFKELCRGGGYNHQVKVFFMEHSCDLAEARIEPGAAG